MREDPTSGRLGSRIFSSLPDVALAWLTLAERDNNVSILCESLAEAIATSVDAAGQRLPVQTGSRPPVEQWLAHFAETLETHERRTS